MFSIADYLRKRASLIYSFTKPLCDKLETLITSLKSPTYTDQQKWARADMFFSAYDIGTVMKIQTPVFLANPKTKELAKAAVELFKDVKLACVSKDYPMDKFIKACESLLGKLKEAKDSLK